MIKIENEQKFIVILIVLAFHAHHLHAFQALECYHSSSCH